jgi:hypothetical protein
VCCANLSADEVASVEAVFERILPEAREQAERGSAASIRDAGMGSWMDE